VELHDLTQSVKLFLRQPLATFSLRRWNGEYSFLIPAVPAGNSFLLYRRRGGSRTSPLPHF
jgi:hypothetical protein